MRHELRAVGENYRDDYAPCMNWQVTMPARSTGRPAASRTLKEIVKYYAQRRGVQTFAPASSTACQDAARTQGNQLRALPGYGPDIARNRAEASAECRVGDLDQRADAFGKSSAASWVSAKCEVP